MHIASIESADGKNPLLELPAFKAFVAETGERCEEFPVTMELHRVGSHRLFAG